MAVWQAVTAKSPSSFESWSNRLLILASYKSSMVRLEKEWANLVRRWLSIVWEASVLASEFFNFSLASFQFLASEFFNFSLASFSISRQRVFQFFASEFFNFSLASFSTSR